MLVVDRIDHRVIESSHRAQMRHDGEDGTQTQTRNGSDHFVHALLRIVLRNVEPLTFIPLGRLPDGDHGGIPHPIFQCPAPAVVFDLSFPFEIEVAPLASLNGDGQRKNRVPFTTTVERLEMNLTVVTTTAAIEGTQNIQVRVSVRCWFLPLLQ